MLFEPSVTTTKPVTVAYLTMRGPYSRIREAIERLYAWISEQGLVAEGMPEGVFLTDPAITPEEEAVWEIRAPLAGEPGEAEPDETGVGIKRHEPTTVVTAVHVGPYSTIESTYRELQAWVTEHGYEVVGPPSEVYHSDPNEVPLPERRTEVRFPVARVDAA